MSDTWIAIAAVFAGAAGLKLAQHIVAKRAGTVRAHAPSFDAIWKIVLRLIGVGVVFNEAVVQDTADPSLIILAAGCLGLPELFKPSPPASPSPPPTTPTPPTGGTTNGK